MTEQQIAAMRQALAWIEANADTQDEWDMVADLRQALEQQPVQVTVKDFVTAVQGKEHLNGKPMYWAQWPNENAIANEALDKMAENARELGLDYEPVAMRHSFDGYGWKYTDSGFGSGWKEWTLKQHPDAEPVYERPQPAAPAIPEGMALVPKRMTKAMRYVTDQGDWTWEDLLRAAEAITEAEYNLLAAALEKEEN